MVPVCAKADQHLLETPRAEPLVMLPLDHGVDATGGIVVLLKQAGGKPNPDQFLHDHLAVVLFGPILNKLRRPHVSVFGLDNRAYGGGLWRQSVPPSVVL